MLARPSPTTLSEPEQVLYRRLVEALPEYPALLQVQLARTLRFKEKGGKTIIKPVADPLADVLDAAIWAGVYGDRDHSLEVELASGIGLAQEGEGAGMSSGKETGAKSGSYSLPASRRSVSEADDDPYLIPGNAVQRRPGATALLC